MTKGIKKYNQKLQTARTHSVSEVNRYAHETAFGLVPRLHSDSLQPKRNLLFEPSASFEYNFEAARRAKKIIPFRWGVV
jgi:hypothetical protein